jgi:DNA mismatch repair protein MutL
MSECRIRVLDEEVANQIAAGEVVERPSSVVKELAENAVDAGATRLSVEIEEGGKRLIRVTDNGCGMTAQEAVLSLQRHATSKIARAEDLAAVRTLGFRGEALPSIASVSRMTVLSRRRGELEGSRLEVDAGEIRELEPAAAPEGTAITVRDLFYNTPARLKFLKTSRTELSQICDVVTRIALSHPGISARLIADGDEVLHAPGSPDPLNTIAELYGKDLSRELVPVAHTRPGLAVEGQVSRPTYSRPTRGGQQFFVNGRWVRSRTLTHALDEAFRATMHPGRFPFAVLHIEIDPALVDVNVHPTKAEVRFLRDWEVHRAVHEAVREALSGLGAAHPSEPLARQQLLSPEALRSGPWLPPHPSDAGRPEAASPLSGGVASDLTPASAPDQPPIPGLPPAGRTFKPVAQLWNSYLLVEGPTGLLVIDQHLAHERVLFDLLLEQRRPGETAGQLLAIPVTLQLPQSEAVVVQELLPDLAAVGFGLEPFGRGAFLVRSTPAFVMPGEELTVLRQLVDSLAHDRGSRATAGVERVAATTACKAAVKKGSRLAGDEIQRLLEDLERSENPHTCPHGCPISVEISYQELLRRFKRI